MKTIKKEIEIAAPKESVWTVLMEDSYQRAWLSNFSHGSHARTDWIVGHKVSYFDDSGMGIFGRIEEKLPYEKLAIVYEGMIINGEEDTESEQGKAAKGMTETYKLSERNGKTLLQIESDMDEKHYDEMSKAWDLAIKKIEELSHAI